jgi:hypothetical protein
VRNPLPPLDQNVLALVERFGWLPSQILAEDEYWINRVLLDMQARYEAAKRQQ